MKDGMVQQFGTPEEIYDRPANVYVASFMGSPSMNLLRVTLKVLNGRLTVTLQTKGGPAMLDLGAAGDALHDGREVMMGLRAEHFHLVADDVPNAFDNAFDTQIDLTEPTGADTYAYTRINDQQVAMRLPPKPVRAAGSRCRVTIDTSAISLFDPTTELRLVL
jgi:multiple sugar transport system ATP-binding protein